MALSLLRATQNTHFPASLMHLNWDSPILTLSFTGCLHNKIGRLVCKTFTNVQFGSLILKIFADECQNFRWRQKQLVCLCIFITVCINVKLKSANVITSRKSQQLELEIVSVVLLSAGLVSPLPPPALATTILFLHQFVVRPDRYWGKFPNCRRQLPSSAPGHNAQYRTLDHRVQTSSWRPPNLPWTPGKLQAGNSLDVLRVDLQKTVFIISINGHRIPK